jgi:hypothetical protein
METNEMGSYPPFRRYFAGHHITVIPSIAHYIGTSSFLSTPLLLVQYPAASAISLSIHVSVAMPLVEWRCRKQKRFSLT